MDKSRKLKYKALEGFFPLATEELAARLHKVYQNEAARQSRQHAATIRHPDSYDDLPEHTKDYDRALAMFILEELLPGDKAQQLESTLRMLRG